VVAWVRLRGIKKGLEYSERGQVLRMGVETAAAQVDWIIHVRPCRWLPPHQDESVSDEKCREIKNRMISALDFLKAKYILAE
jgi:hypothetical protein